MPSQIPLAAIPKQTLNITFDSVAYVLEVIAQPDNTMSMSITRDGQLLVANARCITSYPMLRYRYLQGANGNFIWDTPGDELPNWQNFGVSHYLYFVPFSEMAP